jgi:DNA-binding NarL/FixJ family response regulator
MFTEWQMENPPNREVEKEPPKAPSKPLRTLIVDDSAHWRQFVHSRLQHYANKLQFVGEAGDGVEAVERARSLKPDLILLDVGLPHLDGREAAMQILRVLPHAVIIFLTMNQQPAMVQSALNTGANGYVLKTDVAKELWPAIQAARQGTQFVSSGLRSAGR